MLHSGIPARNGPSQPDAAEAVPKQSQLQQMSHASFPHDSSHESTGRATAQQAQAWLHASSQHVTHGRPCRASGCRLRSCRHVRHTPSPDLPTPALLSRWAAQQGACLHKGVEAHNAAQLQLPPDVLGPLASPQLHIRGQQAGCSRRDQRPKLSLHSSSSDMGMVGVGGRLCGLCGPGPARG